MEVKLKGYTQGIDSEVMKGLQIAWVVMCWRCGTKDKEQMTKHHIIPKVLKPKKNMTIPLCRKCHSEVHRELDSGKIKHVIGLLKDSIK